jgi:hypothetical protein
LKLTFKHQTSVLEHLVDVRRQTPEGGVQQSCGALMVGLINGDVRRLEMCD